MSDTESLRQELLTRLLDRRLTQNTAVSTSPVRPADSGVPAAPQQQQLWLHARMARAVPLYNEPITLRIEEDLNVERFEYAFKEVVERHESWRTVFEWRAGTLLQVPAPRANFALPFLDLSETAEANRERAALALAMEAAKKPFDLSKLPLFRAHLVKFSPRKFRLYLTLHHLIFDGFSLYQLFVPELYARYIALSNGGQFQQQTSMQYADYWWQKQHHNDEVKSGTALRYWENNLRELPDSPLYLDRPRPAVRDFKGKSEQFLIPENVICSIKEVAQQHGSTPYMMYLALLHVLLFHWTEKTDQVIGTESAGRTEEAIYGTVGLFANSIVLRTAVSASDSFLNLLLAVRQTTLTALEHELPFGMLVKRFAKRQSAGANPLFQVFLTIEPPLGPVGAGWSLTHMDVPMGTSKFDLSVELDHRKEGLAGRFIYATDVLDGSTIRLMVNKWKKLMTAVADHPDRTVATLTQELCAVTGQAESQRSKNDRPKWIDRLLSRSHL